MRRQHNVEKQAKRRQAALLLDDVLDERITAQAAINRWPEAGEKPDPSLDAAWQALWHFESDEDKQQSELFYLDAQLELLRQMAGFLREGQDLPPYFLRAYSSEHQMRFFYDLSPVEDSKLLIMRWLDRCRRLWQTAWQLNPFLAKAGKRAYD